MALVTYTFDGLSFARINYNDGDQKFFQRQAILSKEPLIGGGYYRDVAGSNIQPLSFTASFSFVKADRDAMVNKVGRVATLSKSSGESALCVLSNATPSVIGGRYCCEVTFE